MTPRARIDPNVRVRNNQTFVGFEDIEGFVLSGEPIEVYEEETGVVGVGAVTEVDAIRRLVFIAVNWRSLSIRPKSHSWAPATHDDSRQRLSSGMLTGRVKK